MGKYDRLGAFLASRDAEEVPMTFEDIERIIGSRLPDSKAYPAWWSNNPSNNVMTRVWLDAGYRTERVDIGGGRLVFRKVEPATAGPSTHDASARPGLLERIRARLGGTVKVMPGVDLTAPTGEDWGAGR